MLELRVSGLDGLQVLPDRLESAIEPALDRGAQVVLNAKTRQVQKTYSRRIPLRKKSRKPAWTRSGDWLKGQQVLKPRKGERVITTIGKASKYEGRLANLPTSKLDGVNRSNPAAENAVRIVEPQLLPVIEQEIRNALGL